jgi:TolA-binding protein
MTVAKALPALLVALAGLLPQAALAQANGAAGYIDERIHQLQGTLVELSRRIQELQRQNQQLQQQMEKMQASYEQRLERLEKGPPAKPAPRRKGR